MMLFSEAKTLRDFGYDFNAEGQLRAINKSNGSLTDQNFEFNVSDDELYNQKRYTALGKLIEEHVYTLLEKEEGLKRLPVPKKPESTDLASFVFATEDSLKKEKLIILIHGSGVVRAGQWSRRLTIDDNLSVGTQIPYIRKARDLNYGVLVLNTNDNTREIDGKVQTIPGSDNPLTHMESVWRDYVRDCKAKHIAIVAHSYGGEVVIQFYLKHPQDVSRKERVFAVALTDSCYNVPAKPMSYLLKISRNWVRSEKDVGKDIVGPEEDIKRVSAGTLIHERSSSSSMDSVFEFLQARYKFVSDSSDLDLHCDAKNCDSE